ncbi:MAG: ring-cleaving dioxygenase [Chloroflexota bacterium]
MSMNLHGIHHVTAVSARIGDNADFFTRVLGLRLVKKSVNQDDTSAYHLFYADKIGSPGTDMTFFDWPVPAESRGTDSIVNTAFRVNGTDALTYWIERFDAENVPHQGIETFDGRSVIHFEDFEGQRMMLVDDGGAAYEGEAWEGAGVPAEHAIRGFYAVTLSIPKLAWLEPVLTKVLNFVESRRATLPDGTEAVIYDMDGGGPGKEVWVIVEPDKPAARQGAGAVHHVAFRVHDDDEEKQWDDRIRSFGVPTSGYVDRFYFHSIYFRVSNGILFELATDGPGFATDEDADKLGERLALPPFLEHRREQIERGLKPIVVPSQS